MVNHIQDFGENCVSCHDGLDSMVNFDHQTTAFPLEGLHQELACLDCHRVGKPDSEQPRQSLTSTNRLTARPSNPVLPQDNPFANIPNTCAACHSEPPIHLGTFTSECQTCHTPAGWTPALLDGKPFDHTASSGFNLARHLRDSDNRPFACSSCHQQNISVFDQRICLDCHSQAESGATFMTKHIDQFGSFCLDCHDGIDRLHQFDHSRVFLLEGRHSEIDCTACHINKVFSGTPTECIECHTEPVLHAGLFGLHCQYCHTPQNWAPAHLCIHNFPLEHGNKGQNECQVCHLEKYIEYSCYGCHDHQPGPLEASHQKADISPQDLPNCTTCHPAGAKERK